MAGWPPFTDPLLPAEKGDGLEWDELWSFVQSRAQTRWLWVALCRRTRQIVAYTLGDRSQQSAADLRAALPPDHRGRATRSDLWEAYAAAFPARTHRCCGKEAGETNHVERWVGTLRARLSRLVRRAYSFSKCPENHLDAIHLFIATYNLQIQQQATTRQTLPAAAVGRHGSVGEAAAGFFGWSIVLRRSWRRVRGHRAERSCKAVRT